MAGNGPYKLRVLSAQLRAAGSEGQGLRRELYRAVNAAAKPLAKEIKDAGHLRSYMPNRYADVLAADMTVSATKSTGRNPGVAIKAKGRAKKRKLKQLDAEGVLVHPVYGDRDKWVRQTTRVRPGFFSDPCKEAAPDIRDQVLAAMREIGKRITSG